MTPDRIDLAFGVVQHDREPCVEELPQPPAYEVGRPLEIGLYARAVPISLSDSSSRDQRVAAS
jgi:hypothetical protein